MWFFWCRFHRKEISKKWKITFANGINADRPGTYRWKIINERHWNNLRFNQFNMPQIIFEIIMTNLKSLSKVACLSVGLLHCLLSDTDLSADRTHTWISGHPPGHESAVNPPVSSQTFAGFIYTYFCFWSHQRKTFACMLCFFKSRFHKSKGSTNLNILLHFPPFWVSSGSCGPSTDHRGDLKTAMLLFTLWLWKCHRVCCC